MTVHSFAGSMIRNRYLLCALAMFLRNCESAARTSLDSANSTIDITDDATTETHRTMCRITSERLVANAQATFTRVLTGACNAKTIDDRFEKLESSMNKRLDEIKEMIVRMTLNNDSPGISENSHESSTINSMPPARRDEFKRYHDRIHDISTSNGQREVYTYYWRVSNLAEKYSQWETGRSERSSTFYVGRDHAYAMYLRFTPKYFPDGTIFVSVGLTIGLDDAKLAWPFALPIRIELLDVTGRAKTEDRSSRLWDPATVCTSHFWGRPGNLGRPDNPECVGLSIPRQLLVESAPRFVKVVPTWNEKYVWNDSLLVKLSVHL